MGSALGCLLIQLPLSLSFDARVASRFLQLVVEFRAGLRVAVGQVQTGDYDTMRRCLDVPRLGIGFFVWQALVDQQWLRITRQNGSVVLGGLAEV